jgi:oligopeptide transport system ATP-binding protein
VTRTFIPADGREPLIEISDFKVHFDLGGGTTFDKWTGGSPVKRVVKAVDGVSLDIFPGETLGLVGGSGCGKSTLGRALLRLVEPTSGQALRGKDLAHPSPRKLRSGAQIISKTLTLFESAHDVRQIIGEPIETFALARGRECDTRIRELMKPWPGFTLPSTLSHEFSAASAPLGSSRAASPDFIVADEPISALDVSIQAQIMNLLERLQRERNLTYLFISHDLRAIRHVSDRVAVMYLGKLVEVAEAKVIYDDPLMPYTKALISAVPVPDPEVESTRQRMVLPGDVPSPINPPNGCRFHTRCPWAIESCRQIVPPLVEIKPNHFAACIRIARISLTSNGWRRATPWPENPGCIIAPITAVRFLVLRCDEKKGRMI